MVAEYVVGVGASAGGLEALQELTSALPEKLPNVALVVTQHLSPSYKSMLATLLQRHTKTIDVQEIRDGETIHPNKIYITPPDSDLIVKNRRFFLQKPGHIPRPKPSIDIFFQSLAQDYGNHAIGIILSGTGSDGAMGCRAIQTAGGKVIVQNPTTARYSGMPQATLDMTETSLSLSPHEIGARLPELLGQSQDGVVANRSEKIDERRAAWQEFFALLTEKTGVDFSRYKISSIYRRLEKRLAQLGIAEMQGYLRYLRNNPDEIENIYNQILIGVTEFFRDPEIFAALEPYLAEIIQRKMPGDSLRIWVPGCATGEEAYSLAIMLLRFGSKVHELNLQIFATDISEPALRKARAGIYSKSQLQNVPQETLDQFFVAHGEDYEIAKSIRQMVLFSKHDLTQNPPFLRLDLISCRNLLIYFSSGLQQQVIPIFHYALNPDGLLLLGKSESVGEFTDLFVALDARCRIFRRTSGVPGSKPRLFHRPRRENRTATTASANFFSMGMTEIIKETLYNTYENPYVIINSAGEIVHIYGDVRNYLAFASGPLNNSIYKLTQPEIQLEVRSLVGQAVRNRSAVAGKIFRRKTGEEEFLLRILIKPLLYSEPENQLYMVIFENLGAVIEGSAGRQDSEVATDLVAELEREIVSTREQLQTFIEELETANEELQSLNEELQSANEELQSSNEELETSNEELQSSNEELQIAYGELRSLNEQLVRKEQQLELANLQMDVLIKNAQEGYILLDQNFNIVQYNPLAVTILAKIGHNDVAVGKNFLQFISEDRVALISRQLKKALEGQDFEGELKFFSEPEVYLRYRIAPELQQKLIVVSLLDITLEKQQQEELHEKNELLNSVYEYAGIAICILDSKGKFERLNSDFLRLVGYRREELENNELFVLLPPEERRSIRSFIRQLPQDLNQQTFQWTLIRKDGSLREVSGVLSRAYASSGRNYLILVLQDITEQAHYKKLLVQTQQTARVGGWEYDLITGEIVWTEEVYDIHEVGHDYQCNLENNLRFYEARSREVLEKALEQAIQHGRPYDLELEFYSSRGNHKWVRTTCQPVKNYDKVIKLYGTIQDITAIKNKEAEIGKLSLVASSIQNGVFITDRNFVLQWCNGKFFNYFNTNAAAVQGKRFFQVLSENNISIPAMEQLRDLGATEEHGSFEILVPPASGDGDNTYFKIDLTAVKSQQGKLVNWIGIITDITDLRKQELSLRKSLDERTVLLKEIHHRVKNNLAIISSLLQLQQMSLENEQAQTALTESRLRIETMALIHEKLYSASSLSEIRADLYLRDLVQMIVQNMSDGVKNIELEFNLDSLVFPVQPMVTLGLLTSEVVTNSIKHAFTKTEKPKLFFCLRQNQQSTTLIIRDNGSGFTNAPKPWETRQQGIGCMLIHGLAQQLDGRYVYENHPEGGAIFRMDFK